MAASGNIAGMAVARRGIQRQKRTKSDYTEDPCEIARWHGSASCTIDELSPALVLSSFMKFPGTQARHHPGPQTSLQSAAHPAALTEPSSPLFSDLSQTARFREFLRAYALLPTRPL